MGTEQRPKTILRVSKSGWTAGMAVFHHEETEKQVSVLKERPWNLIIGFHIM
jgi:hypothetical protein